MLWGKNIMVQAEWVSKKQAGQNQNISGMATKMAREYIIYLVL